MDPCRLEKDEQYMRQALSLAREAGASGEVAVGAVVVSDRTGEVVGRGKNQRQAGKNPVLHAEISAIVQAAENTGDWRLNGCTLYVTLEPCAMCAGAAINARIGRVVFGAWEPETGCCGSVCNLFAMPFSHGPVLEGGVLASECERVLSEFFAQRRAARPPEADEK